MAEGDIGDVAAYAEVGAVQSLIAGEHADFVLGLGDQTYGNDHGAAAVDGHFNDVMVWSQDAAYMLSWGNHEWGSGDDLRNYKGRFDLPNAQTSPGSPSVSCCSEDWYWFDYGNARVARGELFDAAGRRVRVILDTDHLPAGAHTFTVRGSGDGERLRAGVYFYRVQVRGGVVTGRFIVLK